MRTGEEKTRLLSGERVPKALLTLGLPTMIGMLVSALYNVVDAYFVGGLGTSQMGAVSVSFPIAQVIIGLGMTFGSGAASYLSRLLGEGKSERADRVASTALFSSLAAGVLCIIASMLFLDPILRSLGATETILPHARAYASIFIAGSILNIFTVTMNNLVTAEGATRLTMVSMLTGCGLNAVLDPLFIYTLGWGIRGAAAATVAAQGVTVGIYLWYLSRKRSLFRIAPRLITLGSGIYAEIFKVGIPTLVYQLLTSVALGLTNSRASLYGDQAVAAMGIVTRIMALGSFVVFGYMKGFQPLAGYSFGSGNRERLREAVRVSLLWATGFCCLVSLALTLFPGSIISLFSRDDAEVLVTGSRALRLSGAVFPLFGFQMVYMALFLAAGKGREGGILSVSRQGLFFVPLILVFPRIFGLAGVILAQPCADLLSFLLTVVFAAGSRKTLMLPDSVPAEA